MSTAMKWTLRLAAIPAAVVTYVSVMGLAGYCPMCKSVVDGVLGRHGAMEQRAGAPGTIRGLEVYTLEGESVDLATYVGKPAIVEFWATWCGPCHKQREIMQEMAGELQGRVTLLSLSVDTNPQVVTEFLTGHPSEAVELMAPRELQAAFGVDGVPTLVFVDAAGKVRGVETGVHSAGLLRERVRELEASN